MEDRRMRDVREAADAFASWVPGFAPVALLVLGSGLGGVIGAMDVKAERPFADLPGFASSAVVGHAGRFVLGELAGRDVIAMMGRLHLYEGHPVEQVVLPVRAAALALPHGNVRDIDIQQLRQSIREAGGILEPGAELEPVAG
jgi:hypothetical protein